MKYKNFEFTITFRMWAGLNCFWTAGRVTGTKEELVPILERFGCKLSEWHPWNEEEELHDAVSGDDEPYQADEVMLVGCPYHGDDVMGMRREHAFYAEKMAEMWKSLGFTVDPEGIELPEEVSRAIGMKYSDKDIYGDVRIYAKLYEETDEPYYSIDENEVVAELKRARYEFQHYKF